MQVIVNVDDVGLHPAVQRAVEEGAAAGIVTSASVLANGPYVRDACRLRGIGLGAHLNILRGKPISPPTDVASLVDRSGLFLGDYPRLFLRYLSRHLKPDEVEREWSRQIDSLLSMGLPLTHVDSEKHIHCWPRLMTIACRLARRYGLRWVRCPAEPTAPFRWDGGGLRAKLLSYWSGFHSQPQSRCDQKAAVAVSRSFSDRRDDNDIGQDGPPFCDDATRLLSKEAYNNISWPDAVWGIADQGPALQARKFGSFASRLRDTRVIEIVCHPGKPKPGDEPISETFGRLHVQRLWEPEFCSLMQSDWQNVFDDCDVELVHYGQMNWRNP